MREFDTHAHPNALNSQGLRRLLLIVPPLCLGVGLITGDGMLVFLGIFLAAIIYPAATWGNPAAHGLANAFRIVVALALLLGGLAGCAATVWLFMAGSYAMLASFLIGPISLCAAYMGYALVANPVSAATD